MDREARIGSGSASDEELDREQSTHVQPASRQQFEVAHATGNVQWEPARHQRAVENVIAVQVLGDRKGRFFGLRPRDDAARLGDDVDRLFEHPRSSRQLQLRGAGVSREPDQELPLAVIAAPRNASTGKFSRS